MPGWKQKRKKKSDLGLVGGRGGERRREKLLFYGMGIVSKQEICEISEVENNCVCFRIFVVERTYR